MKKTKRLSIEYRHREVAITVEGSTLHVRDGEPNAANAPACHICGSPWINVAAPAAADGPGSVEAIYRALEQAGLHVEVTSTGQLRVCQRSFENIQPTEATKEKP